jgi:hypothetical protein
MGLVLHQQFWSRPEFRALVTVIDSGGGLFGVGGAVDGKTATAPTVTLGALERRDVPLTLAGGSAGITGSVEIAGNIGGRFLCEFRVLFDYAASRLILYPRPN